MPGLPWKKVHGFHLDEYVGMAENHPASFRRYLRENLTERVPMAEFFEIDGSTPDTDRVRQNYVQELREANPQLCLLGIGENGHLAFNDPPEANFHDPDAMKVVTLDAACRQQQLAEGWFARFEDVPQQALTLTIPTLFKVPKADCFGSRPPQGSERPAYTRRADFDSLPGYHSAHASGRNPVSGPESASELNGLVAIELRGREERQ